MGSRTLHVWYVIGRLDVGGAERTLVNLANNLDPDAFDVTIWTIDEPGPLAADVASHVSLKTLDAAHKADVRAPVRFARELRRESPDILQSFLFFDNTLARLVGTISPETTVITGVREVPNEMSTIRETVEQITLPLSDHIVSNSEAGAQFIIDQGASPDTVSVIRNGRDLAVYNNATAPPGLRSEMGLPSESRVVGTVGRLVERKGHYDLLAAWHRIREKHPNAHLLIVGDGPEYNGLIEKARELRISESVHLPGTRDDVPELLDLMDIFAFPSHYEGLPGALLEAMAAGLPIVTTPVDGNSELVEDRVEGLYTPPKDPATLAKQLDSMLTDTKLADSLGQQAHATATSDFSLNRMVREFESLYQN